MKARRAIAPVLALWLSGLGCLLLCATVCAEAGAAADHSCCARSAALEEDACSGPEIAGEGVPSEGTCCFLETREAPNVPVPDAATPLPAPTVRSVTVVLATAKLAGPPAIVPATSRGDTYLRCCVLLI